MDEDISGTFLLLKDTSAVCRVRAREEETILHLFIKIIDHLQQKEAAWIWNSCTVESERRSLLGRIASVSELYYFIFWQALPAVLPESLGSVIICSSLNLFCHAEWTTKLYIVVTHPDTTTSVSFESQSTRALLFLTFNPELFRNSWRHYACTQRERKTKEEREMPEKSLETDCYSHVTSTSCDM